MILSSVNNEEFRVFINVEKDCIDKDKWLEGERIKCDPGETYILKWINENSKDFRIKWNESQCKHCSLAYKCGHYLRKKCQNFQQKE